MLEFMRLLWAVTHGIDRASKRMAARRGVTGTLTGILQRLQNQGLLERGGHPADARRAVLRLTAAGRTCHRPQAPLTRS